MLHISDNPQTTAELHPNGQTRIKAAAAIIGVHHQTLRRWWKDDKFPKPTDIHGILLFKNADLLSWLASHSTDVDSDQDNHLPAQEA
ncbi:AlpA family transcriptional regulator [Psychrobacter sp. DAB_AL32B]|uniref:helix-turn-helix transcriptional regulator n=1 Tax=Psychrobacter sp. DAB_AL32B TaxID=1028414 RepID=UPI000B7CDB88|nr:helix-turn-helix domain-containing protein [Psychrobacter sp. DAB_AL32B]OXL24607.1 hypothetical protein CAN34_05495 [Psychrobacter sp. DAB_AL32B]